MLGILDSKIIRVGTILLSLAAGTGMYLGTRSVPSVLADGGCTPGKCEACPNPPEEQVCNPSGQSWSACFRTACGGE